MEKDILVLGHCGLGDNIMTIGLVRYLKKYNNVVYVACCKKYIKNLSYFYEDDTNIILYPIDNNWSTIDISFLESRFNLYKLGCFNKNPSVYYYPLSFYDNANIHRKEIINSFKIPSTTTQSVKLYDKVKLMNKKIIFVHNETGTNLSFDIKKYKHVLNGDENDYLYINPNINMYPQNHKYYNLCQELLNQESILFYKDIIINSEILILTDSCFWCLSMFLNLKNKKHYYLTRCNNNFCYLWLNDTATKEQYTLGYFSRPVHLRFGLFKNSFIKLN